jgi:hypothetical protein
MLANVCLFVFFIGVATAIEEGALHLASSEGDIEAVKRLLDEGADVEALEEGFTALHFACFYGHDNIVRWLVEGGKKTTCLSLAKALGHHTLVRWLEQHALPLHLLFLSQCVSLLLKAVQYIKMISYLPSAFLWLGTCLFGALGIPLLLFWNLIFRTRLDRNFKILQQKIEGSAKIHGGQRRPPAR